MFLAFRVLWIFQPDRSDIQLPTGTTRSNHNSINYVRYIILHDAAATLFLPGQSSEHVFDVERCHLLFGRCCCWFSHFRNEMLMCLWALLWVGRVQVHVGRVGRLSRRVSYTFSLSRPECQCHNKRRRRRRRLLFRVSSTGCKMLLPVPACCL